MSDRVEKNFSALVPASIPASGASLSSARYLGPSLFGLIAGVAFQLQQPALFAVAIYLGLLAGAMVAIAVTLLMFRRISELFNPFRAMSQVQRLATPLVLVLLFALSGFGMAGVRAVVAARTALDPALEGKDLLVTGQVSAMPQFGEEGLRFRFALESASLEGRAVTLPPQIYLGWYAGFGAPAASKTSSGRMRDRAQPDASATTDDSAEPAEFAPDLRRPQTLRAGERWRMTVRLKAPHGNSNPHGFDYELWLWEQGLQATGYVRTGKRDAPPQKLESTLWHPVERARQSVREAIFARVEDRQLAGVLAALVVGDQNAIGRADWDVFRATGVAHLISISGLHITMFAWLASVCISAFWRRSARLTPRLCLGLPASSAGALGGLMLAALYALFSGWGVPAQRTIWMLACVVLLRQTGRQWPWPLVWLLAMAVVVLLDPWALMQAGFWLSFVAVGVLFATDSGADSKGSKRATASFDTKKGRFPYAGGAAASVGADGPGEGPPQASPAPSGGSAARAAASVGAIFREQWVVTLALTPLSLLLFNQVSLVGLLANAVAIPWVTLFVTPLAMLGVLWPIAWDGAAWAINLLVIFLQWLAGWPLASISVAAPPLWSASAGVAGGLLLATRLPWHWRLLGFPLLLPVLLWQPLRPAQGQFEVLGADIGQGNAVIVRTATHTLLYDTGPRFSSESDAGHRVLVPLLRATGERLDILMLSHRDLDHIGGAPAVLGMQPQARLISSIEDSHELQASHKSERCLAGQKWEWDGVSFEVLHPVLDDYDSHAKSNAMSCVLRISNGASAALLAGDLESAQEARLAADPAVRDKLRSDFLLMPHHGSKTSSSGVFLDLVKPQLALAQAGYRNRFGHPAPLVLERYRERSIGVINSARCGAARWRSEQPGAASCQRELEPRYWQHRPDEL